MAMFVAAYAAAFFIGYKVITYKIPSKENLRGSNFFFYGNDYRAFLDQPNGSMNSVHTIGDGIKVVNTGNAVYETTQPVLDTFPSKLVSFGV